MIARRALPPLIAGLAALPAAAQTGPRAAPPPSAAPSTAPAALTDRDRADIGRAEAWLGQLRSVKARFLQIAQNGASAEGTAWIVRPDRMRFEYDPPEPLLLVASYNQFFYFDRQLKQASVVPVGSTPLGLLLRPDTKLSGDVTVTRVERVQGLLRISLHRTGAPAEGRLTLVFGEQPFELRQWAVVDAQGQETRVTLTQPQYDQRFPSILFDFNDPRFREALGIQ